MEIIKLSKAQVRRFDLASTDLGVPEGTRTELEIPRFKKPLKRRLRELFERH